MLEMILDFDDCAERATFEKLHFIGFVQVPVLFFKISVNVPCVPLFGFIHERLQQVSAG